jgi:hypothetical protein
MEDRNGHGGFAGIPARIKRVQRGLGNGVIRAWYECGNCGTEVRVNDGSCRQCGRRFINLPGVTVIFDDADGAPRRAEDFRAKTQTSSSFGSPGPIGRGGSARPHVG